MIKISVHGGFCYTSFPQNISKISHYNYFVKYAVYTHILDKLLCIANLSGSCTLYSLNKMSSRGTAYQTLVEK